MQRLIRYSLIAICALGSAATAQPASDVSVDQIMTLSGITRQIPEFPSLIKSGMRESLGEYPLRVPAETLARIDDIIDTAYHAGPFLLTMRQAIASRLSQGESDDLLSWLESDFGRRITEAEVAASTVEAYVEMMQQADALMADKERVEAAARLVKLVGATDIALRIDDGTTMAMIATITKLRRPDEEIDLSRIQTLLDATATTRRARLEQLGQLSTVYCYRQFEMSELQTYNAFLATPAAQAFYRAANEGMLAAFNGAAVALSNLLIQYREDLAERKNEMQSL